MTKSLHKNGPVRAGKLSLGVRHVEPGPVWHKDLRGLIAACVATKVLNHSLYLSLEGGLL